MIYDSNREIILFVIHDTEIIFTLYYTPLKISIHSVDETSNMLSVAV